MKKWLYLVFWTLLLSPFFSFSQSDFITRWNLATTGSGATQLSFGVATSGTVSYTWTTVPAGTSGSGTFTGPTATISNLPTGATIDLSISPTNFQRIIMNSGPDKNRLIDVKQWGSVAWTSMTDAFNNCIHLNVSAADVPNLLNVTSLNAMFYNCMALTGPANINTWNVSTVTDMGLMFKGAKVFNQPLNSWNTAAVTNMGGMFKGAKVFNQPLNSWNTAAVTNMAQMFFDATAFNQPLHSWNTAAVTEMSSMFGGASAFNQPLNSWNTAAVTSMYGMFNGAKAFNQPLNSWNTAAVTDMSDMFGDATAFNQPLHSWNTAAVTNMVQMFENATAFNQPLNSWNTAAVTNMYGMFNGAKAFNQPLNSWNTAAVTNMYGMFNGAKAFNQPIDSWNTSAVTDMGLMFKGATAFNQPLNSWNTAAVTDMNYMFAGAAAFNQPLHSWNTAAVTDMGGMFAGTLAFNQNISAWNIAAVTEMSGMFSVGTAFNQSLAAWGTKLKANVILDNFLDDCGMNVANYDATLTGFNAGSVTGRSMGAAGRQYCASKPDRDHLVLATGSGGKGWVITGDSYAGGNCCVIAGSFSGPNPVCQGSTSALLPNTGGTWISNDPNKATVTADGQITALLPGTVTFTFTTPQGCTAESPVLTIKPTPASALTASQTEVCPNTQVTLDAHCAIPTATVNWNPGAPTVIPDAANVGYVYRARCVSDGCAGNESSVEVRTHRILVEMKTVGAGTLPQPLSGTVIANMAPTNTVTASANARGWTMVATGCAASEAAVFRLMGPVSFSSIDNGAPYALFANEGANFYSLEHPNYGTGGSFPNGTYHLTVELRSADGVGGPFPKNRAAAGVLLATRSLQFTVQSPPSVVGSRRAILSESGDRITENAVFAQVMPNPVANILHLKVSEVKDQKVNVILMDVSGRALLQRSFVPETNTHQEEFEVSQLSNGLYFLHVNTAGTQAALKVFKVQ